MDQIIFNKFREIVYKKAGITLDDTKKALLSARLTKRLRQLKIDDFAGYLHFLEEDQTGQEIVEFINVISTNVTSFFRGPKHFERLTKLTEEWLNNGQRKFRIWSAASSSGEEPYTIAMVMMEAAGQNADIKILGTDIDTTILAKCNAGIYDKDKVKDIPIPLIKKYFNQLKDKKSGKMQYQVKDFVKEKLKFKRLNLSKTPFPMKGPMDAVFCRNVMIYFDIPVKEKIINEVVRLLKQGGVLMVGHSESLTGIKSNLQSIEPAVYQKPQ